MSGSGGPATYLYDAFGRMVSQTETALPRTSSTTAKHRPGAQRSGQVIEHKLNGPAVNQVLATETVAPGSGLAGTVNWFLTDNQGSVRDVVQYSGGATSPVDHLVYDCFGQIASQTQPANQPRFTYTGMRLDPVTGLYYDNAR